MPWFKTREEKDTTGLYNANERAYSRLLVIFFQLLALTPMLLVLIADWYPNLKFSSIGLIKSTACPGFEVYFGWPASANCVEWDSFEFCGIKLTQANMQKYFGGVPPDFPAIVVLRNKYGQFQVFPILALASLGGLIISFWLLVALSEKYSGLRLHKPDQENPLGIMVWLFGLSTIAFNIVTVIYTADYDSALSNAKYDPLGKMEAGAIAFASVSLVLVVIFFYIIINGLRVETHSLRQNPKPKPTPKVEWAFQDAKLVPKPHPTFTTP